MSHVKKKYCDDNGFTSRTKLSITGERQPHGVTLLASSLSLSLSLTNPLPSPLWCSRAASNPVDGFFSRCAPASDIVDTRSPSLSVSLAPNKSTNLANVKKIQEEPVFREPYKDPESEPPNPWLTESSPKRGRFVVVGGSSATKSSSSIECLTLEENWGKSASFSSKPMSKSCEEGSSKTIRGGGKQELATATSVFVVVVVRTVDVAFGSWYFREPIKFRNRQVGRFRRLRMGTEGISTARQRFWSSCSRYSVSIGSRSGREPNPSLSSSNVSSLS